MRESQPILLDGQTLRLEDVVDIARGQRRVELCPQARERMNRSYDWVAEAGKRSQPVYGVTTGFGSLARLTIPPEQRAQLSLNLIRSHAAGVGRPLSPATVRAMMLLRANALAKGVSGCRPLLVETLLSMLNRRVTPVVPSQGSCGSSGDLAPLAHLGLVMTAGLSDGRATVDGQVLPGDEAMALAGIPQIELEAKDGLAITNGAQLTTAIAALNCLDAKQLILQAEVVAAMSIEALRGASRAFHPLVHQQRPYVGARAVAANLCRLMEGSQLVDSMPEKVQDAYSLRCSPQVLGACRDMVAFASGQVEVELNAATDNPLILLDAEASPQGFVHDPSNHAYSAGMFHGEPVGMAMDTLKIAVAELASLSERRLYRLTTGSLSQRLPPGLARKDRPELGLVLPHTTAAALVSENKALGWPASLDSIPTCEDQEDHVAMSTTAARRAQEVVNNSRRVVAIELLGAVQALEFRLEEDPAVQLGRGTRVALERVRKELGDLGVRATPSVRIERLHSLLLEGGLLDRMPPLVRVGHAPEEEG